MSQTLQQKKDIASTKDQQMKDVSKKTEEIKKGE